MRHACPQAYVAHQFPFQIWGYNHYGDSVSVITMEILGYPQGQKKNLVEFKDFFKSQDNI